MNNLPQLPCYLCQQITKDMLEYDEQNNICRPCHQQQLKEAAYYKSLRTNKFPQIDQIHDGIFLGNEDAATNQQILKDRDITAICVCGSALDTPFLKDQRFEYKHFQIADFPKQNIEQYFAEHYAWMKKMRDENRKILIHCAAGVSRSASFTIAYFMKELQISFMKALQFVRAKRRWANPNSGFRGQLLDYQKILFGKIISKVENEYPEQ